MTVRSQQSPNSFPEKCLVTGAGGFIGNALCSELRRRGATIHGCGRTAPAGASIDVSHQCDVSALSEVRQIIDEVRPAVVFHCASKVTGARELEAVMPTFYDNLVGAVNILQAATETGDIRVVQLGSLQEPDEPTSQGIAPSPYAASKLAASAYTRMFAELYALPASVARVFMVYGPGQLDFAKLIPYVLKSLLNGQTARMSSGRQEFDWVYVDDVVDALIAIAANDGLRGRTVDVGSGTLTSVRDIAMGLGQRLDLEGLLDFDAIPDRRLEPTRKADIEATAALLGWRSRVSLEEGLDRTVAWYQRHLGRLTS